MKSTTIIVVAMWAAVAVSSFTNPFVTVILAVTAGIITERIIDKDLF